MLLLVPRVRAHIYAAQVPSRGSREMFEAILDARGLSRARVRREVIDRGTAREAVELSVEPNRAVATATARPQTSSPTRGPKGQDTTTSSSPWPEIRYTEYTRGGHDAWTRALRDPRVREFVLGRKGRDRECNDG